jgi:hypothetical protein
LVVVAGVLEVEQLLAQVKVLQEATQPLQATLLLVAVVLETLGVAVLTVVGPH